MSPAIAPVPDCLSAAASRFTRLAAPEDHSAANLLAYWQAKCGDRRMPARPDIHPGEMRAHLPNLLLLEPLEDCADFRIRLFGSHLVDIYGMELTGRCLSSLTPEASTAKWRDLATECVRTAAPIAARTRMAIDGRYHLVYETLLLPLSPDDGTVTQILGHIGFPDARLDTPARWFPAALR